MIDAIDTPAAASITADRMARIVRDFRAAITHRTMSGYEAWYGARMALTIYVSGDAADEILAETLASMAR